MEEPNERTKKGLGEPASPKEGLDALNLESFLLGLMDDLKNLRNGNITVIEARARAQLAHEFLRGVNMVLSGAKMKMKAIEASAKTVGGKGTGVVENNEE